MASPSRRLQTKPVITCLKSVLLTYTFVFWVSAGPRPPRPTPATWRSRAALSRQSRATAAFPSPQVSGIVLLAVGVWGRVSLAVYFSLLDEKATNVPFILVGAGTVVVLLGTFGCFATCRGSTWMLKLVGGPGRGRTGSHPLLTHPGTSHPSPFHPTPSCPIDPILPHLIPSHPVPSRPILPHPSHPTPFHPPRPIPPFLPTVRHAPVPHLPHRPGGRRRRVRLQARGESGQPLLSPDAVE